VNRGLTPVILDLRGARGGGGDLPRPAVQLVRQQFKPSNNSGRPRLATRSKERPFDST
jgi:hypothetical protein